MNPTSTSLIKRASMYSWTLMKQATSFLVSDQGFHGATASGRVVKTVHLLCRRSGVQSLSRPNLT